ncbi:MAG: hypothetical protein ACKVHP_11755, partial [Verrucomicrobiales bacterium]
MILGVALMGLPFTSSPAFGEAHIRNSSQYELAARPLRNATEVPFRFSQARLSDVLRMLADEAGINFISLPSDQTDASRLVTFTFEMSPFAALETMAQDNGIALVYNNRGFWSLKASNSSELVAKSYYIQHNTKEKIEVSDSSSGSSSGSSSSSRGGAAGGAGPSTGIDLQGGPST